MKFKALHMKEQFEACPQKLLDVCEAFNQLSLKEGIEPVITRVTDAVEGESGVHRAHRAVDFRNEFQFGKSKRWLYPIETVEHILDALNKRFPRTDGRLVAIHHSFNNGPFHFHLQIPASWLTKEEFNRLNKKT